LNVIGRVADPPLRIFNIPQVIRVENVILLAISVSARVVERPRPYKAGTGYKGIELARLFGV
jgi:hypothetical protein